MSSILHRIPARFVACDKSEADAALWSFTYFFCLLASYYILQPLRDQMGLDVGVERLPRLFQFTLLVMIVANPVFSWLVGRCSRAVFIPMVYRFFLSHLLLFYLGFQVLDPEGRKVVAQVFYVWVSVFNLFAVSVFWGLMADLFSSDQGKRLFGFIGAGGTLGQLAGSLIAGYLVHLVGNRNLLIVSFLLLEASVVCVHRLVAAVPAREDPARPPGPAGSPGAGRKPGSAIEGLRLISRSPYLLGICLYMFLYTFTSSFLYFQKQEIVALDITSGEARTAFFSRINLAVSILTVAVQLSLTGRVIPRIGVAWGLMLVPLFTAVSFLGLGLVPTLVLFATVDVLRKTLNYAIARPSREILYTVLGRDEKYRSKSFIDTFVYRGGDALASGAFEGLRGAFDLGFRGVSWSAVPVSLLWILVGGALGAAQARRAGPADRSVSRQSVDWP